MSIRKNLNAFNNVGANQTAQIANIVRGMTYENIVLELGGTAFTKANISEIRLRLGDKTIWQISGSDLDKLNSYYGIKADATRLPLWFADPNASSLPEYLAGALDTSLGYSAFSMEVDIGAATAPTLAAYATVSNPIPKDKIYAGMFRTLLRQIQTPQAANILQALQVQTGGDMGALIRAVHYFHANITQIDVKKDGFALQQNGYLATVQSMQAETQYTNSARAIQAGLFSWDPMANKHYLSEAVPTINPDGKRANFEHLVAVSAADTLRVFADLYQTHPGI